MNSGNGERNSGRPRNYIRVNGKEITGVSKMPDGRYYIIVGCMQRKYFRSPDEARAAYLADQMRDLSPIDRAELIANAEVRRAAALEQLDREGLLNLADEPVTPPGSLVFRQDDLDIGLFRYLQSANKRADLAGVPQLHIRHEDRCRTRSSAPNISKVLAEWRRLKSAARRGQETEHMRDVARVFRRFPVTSDHEQAAFTSETALAVRRDHPPPTLSGNADAPTAALARQFNRRPVPPSPDPTGNPRKPSRARSFWV